MTVGNWLLTLPLLFTSLACGAGVPAALPAPHNLPPDSASHWKAPPPRAGIELKGLPAIPLHSFQMKNGLTVTIVNRAHALTTQLFLWVPEARGNALGSMGLMIESLRAGTRLKNESLAFDPGLSGQRIFGQATGHGALLAWRVEPRATKVGLEMLSAYATRPAFDQDDFSKEVRRTLVRIERYSHTLAYLTQLGRSGMPSVGLKQPNELAVEVAATTATTLSTIHKCFMLPTGAELVIAGPQSVSKTETWARTAFEGWDSKTATFLQCKPLRDKPPLAPEKLDRPYLMVMHAGAKQPRFRTILPAPPVQHEDFVPFSLAASAMAYRQRGIASNLRLSGATYGIHARLNTNYPNQSFFEMYGTLGLGRATESLTSVIADLKTFSESIADEDIEIAKRTFLTHYLADLNDEQALAGRVLRLRRQGRTAGDLSAAIRKDLGTSPASVREAARRWTRDVAPVIVVAGLKLRAFKRMKLKARIKNFWIEQVGESRLEGSNW